MQIYVYKQALNFKFSVFGTYHFWLVLYLAAHQEVRVFRENYKEPVEGRFEDSAELMLMTNNRARTLTLNLPIYLVYKIQFQ